MWWREDVAEQLGVLAALDAQVARHLVELALRLLRDQVVEHPRRIGDGDARVGFHRRHRLGQRIAEDAVVVGQVHHEAAARLRHREHHVRVAADRLRVPDRADRQPVEEARHHRRRVVGAGVVRDHQLVRMRKRRHLHDQALEQRRQVAAAVVGRHADAEQGGRGVGHDGAVGRGIRRFWPAPPVVETRKNGPSTPLIAASGYGPCRKFPDRGDGRSWTSATEMT